MNGAHVYPVLKPQVSSAGLEALQYRAREL